MLHCCTASFVLCLVLTLIALEHPEQQQQWVYYHDYATATSNSLRAHNVVIALTAAI